MSLEFVVLVLGILFCVAVAVIVYVVKDIRSGNYRKLLSARTEHEELQKTVRDVRKNNMGV